MMLWMACIHQLPGEYADCRGEASQNRGGSDLRFSRVTITEIVTYLERGIGRLYWAVNYDYN